MNRRAFISLISGAAAAWPLAAHAQQGERLRRVGVLMSTAEDDVESRERIDAFLKELARFGWTVGRNLQVDIRWPAGDADRIRRYAAELVALAPDVMLAMGATVGSLQQATQSVPIVFVIVADPVGGGLVESLARPGTNATGFASFEYSMGGKWLELLREIAPGVKRVAVLRDPTLASGSGQFGAIQSVAPMFAAELTPIAVRTPEEIERGVTAFVRASSGGLIVTGSAQAVIHRQSIIKLAERHKLPAVYFQRMFAKEGGLISYGPDFLDQFQRAAGYVDRILKGEKPADLPVQAPTKYELVINLKTARALGLTVPPTLLARADEVIE
jgi:putative tryptophan/tyrosine transport system substrate-binding protein